MISYISYLLYRLAFIRLLPLSDLLSVAVIGFRKNTSILSVAVYRLISLSVAVLWHNFAIGCGVAIKLQDPQPGGGNSLGIKMCRTTCHRKK